MQDKALTFRQGFGLKLDYWRAVLGGTMLALVLLFPQGLAGFARLLALRWQARRSAP